MWEQIPRLQVASLSPHPSKVSLAARQEKSKEKAFSEIQNVTACLRNLVGIPAFTAQSKQEHLVPKS